MGKPLLGRSGLRGEEDDPLQVFVPSIIPALQQLTFFSSGLDLEARAAGSVWFPLKFWTREEIPLETITPITSDCKLHSD